MIHNVLLIKNGVMIYNYATGTKKSLDEDVINGLLEAIFGIGELFFQKQINKIMFAAVRMVFRALGKNLFLGVVEDLDSDDITVKSFVKEVSKTLKQIALLLENQQINHLTVRQIPFIQEEIEFAIEKALHKTPCAFLRKRFLSIIRGYSCTFIEKPVGRSPLCSLYDLPNCPYLHDEQLWQQYRTSFKFNDGMQIDEAMEQLGRWDKTEKYSLHILRSSKANGTTAMELRLKLKGYELDISPKEALDIMSKLQQKGLLISDSPFRSE